MAIEEQKAGHTTVAVVKDAVNNRTFFSDVEESVSAKSPATQAVDRFLTNPKNPNAVTNLVRSLQEAQQRGQPVTFEETALAHAIEAAGLDPTVANEILKLAKQNKDRVTASRANIDQDRMVTTALMARRPSKLPPSPFEDRKDTYAATIADAVKDYKIRQREG